jgi:hypothetical protein
MRGDIVFLEVSVQFDKINKIKKPIKEVLSFIRVLGKSVEDEVIELF